MSTRKSYLIILFTLFVLATWTGAGAQSIFLQPDVKYVTTGVGTEFDLELRVDAAITSLKSFIYHIDFDPAKLDTVSVTQGPLLPSSGATTAFGAYIVHDTILQIEDLILGAGIDVSGPGLVATIRFRVLDTGAVILTVVNHRVRDVAGDLLDTDAYGGVVYINLPPQSFNLLSPIDDQAVSGLPGEFVSMNWETTTSVYPGDPVQYDLECSNNGAFPPGSTRTISGLTTNSYSLGVSQLVWAFEGTYYWRVTASGTTHGFERTSPVETFAFNYTHVPPSAFSLLAPADGSIVSGVAQVHFDWDNSTTVIPGDFVSYTLFLSTDPLVIDDIFVEQTTMVSSFDVAAAGLPRNTPIYWKVNAVNHYAMVTSSNSIFDLTLPGCCVMRVGDANNNGDDEPTIGDVSLLIDAKFITGNCDAIACLQEADVNQSGGVEPDCEDLTIGDISNLIDYLFITGQTLGLHSCF